jgi:LPS-assembly protein
MIRAVFGDWMFVIITHTRKTIFAAFLLFPVHYALCTNNCFAADTETVITSDTLEYFSETGDYVAKGSVTIKQEAATAHADEMIYHEDTGNVHAEGNVRFDDPSASGNADKADLNMEKKTGTLYGAKILFKEENYHLSGSMIERKSENEFYSRDQAGFTTCNGIPAAWCFRGREVDLVAGDRLTARDASFRIRNIPVLYSPFLYMPVLTERKTGLLMPIVSVSNTRGFGLLIPFYWAISENRDATFVLDTYTKRGIGTGLEYRFIEPDGVKSEWWLYHIRDRELHKDFIEVKALHENRTGRGMEGFLSINYVNEQDFYREFNPNKEKQIQRFLQSTGEFSIPLEHARLYLLGQYWVDLNNDTGNVPQKLPEIGYVLNYTRFGSVLVSAEATGTNLWRENGISAQRLDIYPKVLHSLGRDVVLSQTIAARGTAYAFHQNDNDNEQSNTLRAGFEYDGNIHTRLYRKYNAFTHVIEPMVRYHFISSSDDDLPVFDEKELFKITSRIEFSIMNRIIARGKELVSVRVTQPIDTYEGDRPFMPLQLDIGIRNPLPLMISATYDVHTGSIKTVSSEITIPYALGAVTFSQRYNKDQDIRIYKAGLTMRPVKAVQMGVEAWYDAKGEGLTNLSANLQYVSQCWGVRLHVSQTPIAFSVMGMIDLYGITAKRPKGFYDG